MKFRFAIMIVLASLLSACNFTLAEDVTPPPNYVPPTPAPTLGPLFPAQAPNPVEGAAIFAEKCAPCHGATGLGDGPQGIQLGVTVPAFGLPEIARPASPAQWYTTVTRGNMERFMPPFASLNDQQRWDVVAYAMTLHTSEEEVAKGQKLFEANCANCSTDFFKDQAKMSALSEVELARLIKQGNEQIPAFGSSLSEDDVWAVADYLRSLSFNSVPAEVAAPPSATAVPATPVVEATITPGAGTTSPEGTPGATEQATATPGATAVVQAGFGTVSGTVENNTGADLPADLKVTLRGYDHGSDPSKGPQEVFTQEGKVNADGSFRFENVEIPLNRIFIGEVTFEGTNLRSDFAIVKEGDTAVSLPSIKLYNKSDDTSKLVIDEARIFFEYGTDAVQVYNVYSFRNPTDKMIIVALNPDGTIPFFKAPAGSSGFGYEQMQDSQSLVQTENGFGIPPSQGVYRLLVFASLPNTKKIDFSQEFSLPVAAVSFFVPEGVKAANANFTDLGVQAVQDLNFQIYELDNISAGQKVTVGLSGTPKTGTAASTPEVTSNKNILIGAGALGIALILAGAWMYLRDRNHAEDASIEEGKADEFESADDVMDAIIALDDLHRARNISDEAYQKRRAELKEILKGKM
ncbi:MAG TPA: c-type cytochrome [Anaerolineales bacterium]|nr:c-type cytochrome [Anaerolineales bacterium]